ncbi:MAG: hypothetical protein LUE14_05125 [Clostridiales bacterium]|nr:hypothetical protein [Clostridiales bacterium]
MVVEDVDALSEEITPYFVQCYNGEITEEKYIAFIVPVLEEAGYYENLANYIGTRSWVEEYDSWNEILEIALKGDLSDEIYEACYSPLESLDPR